MKDFYKVSFGGFTHLFFDDIEKASAMHFALAVYDIEATWCGLQITVAGELPWI